MTYCREMRDKKIAVRERVKSMLIIIEYFSTYFQDMYSHAVLLEKL
jgi:hypothetical protein